MTEPKSPAQRGDASPLPPPPEWLSEITRIVNLLPTQDNRSTASPVYEVREKKRIYGMDGDYGPGDNWCWLDDDDYGEIDAEESAILEAQYQESYEEPSGYTRVFYQDVEEVVKAFFTLEGAEQYIKSYGYNHNEPYVYVSSGYRNPEWNAIRNALPALLHNWNTRQILAGHLAVPIVPTREMIAHAVDEVFDGGLEDPSIIEEIWRAMLESTTKMDSSPIQTLRRQHDRRT